MKKFSLILLAACAIAVPASAQTKIAGTETCAKPDTQQMVDVSDTPGHMLMVTKGGCTWGPAIMIAGEKSVSSVDSNTGELMGTTVTQHGYDVGTMDNGDTYVAKYSGTATMAKDGSSTFHGTWTFTSGTGKLKGLTGSGMYGGTAKPDGSGASNIKGTYTLPMSSMKPMAAPAPKPAS